MKNKNLLYFLVLCIFLAACAADANQVFQDLKSNFDQEQSIYFSNQKELTPHLQVFDSTRLQRIDQFIQKYKTELAEIQAKRLTPAHQEAYTDMQDFLQQAEQTFLVEKRAYWDPSFYNVYPHFEAIFSDSTSLDSARIDRLTEFVQLLPAHYASATQNLKEASIQQVGAAKEDLFHTYHVVKYELLKQLQKAGTKLEAFPALSSARTDAIYAVKDYLAFCKSLEFEYGEEQSQWVFRDSL